MAVPLATLKTELQTDPLTLGYAPFIATGTTWQLAVLLNQPRAAIRIFRSSVPTWEIVACTVKSEYDALSAGDKQLYQVLVSTGTVNAADSRIRAMFASIFSAGPTRTALAAMAERDGSRAEQLFGQAVTSDECSAALRS